MDKKTLIISSTNKGKLSEFEKLLGFYFNIKNPLDFDENYQAPEEDGDSFEANALIKINNLKLKYSDNYILSDDSGLSVDYLNGEPGIYSGRYAGEDVVYSEHKNKVLRKLKKIKNRSAHFNSTFAFYIPGKDTYIFSSQIHGNISDDLSGETGFGYDDIFIPDNYDKTFADLGEEIKLQISPRAQGVKKLIKFLKKQDI